MINRPSSNRTASTSLNFSLLLFLSSSPSFFFPLLIIFSPYDIIRWKWGGWGKGCIFQYTEYTPLQCTVHRYVQIYNCKRRLVSCMDLLLLSLPLPLVTESRQQSLLHIQIANAKIILYFGLIN